MGHDFKNFGVYVMVLLLLPFLSKNSGVMKLQMSLMIVCHGTGMLTRHLTPIYCFIFLIRFLALARFDAKCDIVVFNNVERLQTKFGLWPELPVTDAFVTLGVQHNVQTVTISATSLRRRCFFIPMGHFNCNAIIPILSVFEHS
jgi:hypothetical protein